VARVCHPSTLRILIWPEASNAQNSIAAVFADGSTVVEHRVETPVGQRSFGLTLGYEDRLDHDELRKDLTLAVLAGKLKPVLDRTARRFG
jgi:hypothetical protein